jgi:hypothetical protein
MRWLYILFLLSWLLFALFLLLESIILGSETFAGSLISERDALLKSKKDLQDSKKGQLLFYPGTEELNSVSFRKIPIQTK